MIIFVKEDSCWVMLQFTNHFRSISFYIWNNNPRRSWYSLTYSRFWETFFNLWYHNRRYIQDRRIDCNDIILFTWFCLSVHNKSSLIDTDLRKSNSRDILPWSYKFMEINQYLFYRRKITLLDSWWDSFEYSIFVCRSSDYLWSSELWWYFHQHLFVV